MSRIIRTAQLNPDPAVLRYPFSNIEDYYGDTVKPKTIIGEPEEHPIDFPNCVSRYLWIHQGANDEEPWLALFEYVDGVTRYGYYRAECDFTGFDCRGSMQMFVSSELQTLLDKALTDYDYELYCQEN